MTVAARSPTTAGSVVRTACPTAGDILEHFDEYARGDGQLQRKAMYELGIDVFEAPRCSGGCDRATEELTERPFVVAISQAIDASQRLHAAI